MCPSPLCTQWTKFNSTQTRDLCTRVIFSCKLQLMSRTHLQRALPVSKQFTQPAAQIHRWGDKWRPVRIPDLYRKSMILLFSPSSHQRVISTFCRARQCGVQATRVQAPRAAVCKPPGHRGGGCPRPRSPLPDPRFWCNPWDASTPTSKGFLCTDTTLPTGTPAPGQTGACPRLCPR